MSTVIIKTGTERDFFKRGKKIARLADEGKPIPVETVLSFEDPADITRLLTTARLTLFRMVKEQSGSISELSQRLDRDRSAVKRDVDALAAAGLVQVEDCALPGHGRMKRVSAAAKRFKLMAVLG